MSNYNLEQAQKDFKHRILFRLEHGLDEKDFESVNRSSLDKIKTIDNLVDPDIKVFIKNPGFNAQVVILDNSNDEIYLSRFKVQENSSPFEIYQQATLIAKVKRFELEHGRELKYNLTQKEVDEIKDKKNNYILLSTIVTTVAAVAFPAYKIMDHFWGVSSPISNYLGQFLAGAGSLLAFTALTFMSVYAVSNKIIGKHYKNKFETANRQLNSEASDVMYIGKYHSIKHIARQTKTGIDAINNIFK